MAKVSFKHYTAGALALIVAVFVGCMGNDNPQGPSSTDNVGTLSIKVNTGTLSGLAKSGLAKSGLSKGSAITLSKLVITMVSNSSTPTATDTIRDTITVGEQNFSATATDSQTVDSVYTLKALRTWYITAKTLDANDSVIHIKSDSIVRLLAGETRVKSLTLAPRFVMYKANFNFPDSLATAATTIRQKLNVTRLVMKVNGDTVVNYSPILGFDAGTPYSISYDYVPVNSGTTVVLAVIGHLSGWSLVGDTVLYQTSFTVSAQGPGADSTKLVNVPYVGPVSGKADLSVTIQRVGLYQVTATTDSTVIPKKASK